MIVPVTPPAVVLAPAPGASTIALLLPLASASYGRAAEAVQAGFLAAAETAGEAARVRVFGHGDDGVLPAFAAAASTGPALVVGPLTRDDLKTVAAMALARPRMLALNQLDDWAPLPDNAYALSLSIESDAAQLAAVAKNDGTQTIAAVAADVPFQQRFRAAFVAAWEQAGGTRVPSFRFDPSPELLGLLRHELAAKPPDAVLLAIAAADAGLVKSFLPPVSVYASSQITDDQSEAMLRDLDNVRFVEIPWLADPDNSAFAPMRHADLGSPVLERLYALGLDAYAIAQMLAEPVPPDRIEYDGATGHLSLGASRMFLREGRVMVIRDGRPVPYQAAR